MAARSAERAVLQLTALASPSPWWALSASGHACGLVHAIAPLVTQAIHGAGDDDAYELEPRDAAAVDDTVANEDASPLRAEFDRDASDRRPQPRFETSDDSSIAPHNHSLAHASDPDTPHRGAPLPTRAGHGKSPRAAYDESFDATVTPPPGPSEHDVGDSDQEDRPPRPPDPFSRGDAEAYNNVTPIQPGDDDGERSTPSQGSRPSGAASAAASTFSANNAERERALDDDNNQEGGYMPCIAGDVLGERYVLVRELGRGESSVVWLAKEARPLMQHATSSGRADTTSPSGRSTGSAGSSATRFFALKVFRCEPRLRDSMAYEHRLMAFVTRRLTDAAMRAAGGSVLDNSTDSFPARGSPSRHSAASGDVDPDIGVCCLRDHFTQMGPHGEHPCLAFDVLGPPVDWVMERFGFEGIPSRAIVLDIVTSTLRTLVQLDSVHVIHTDLKPENLLFVQPRARLQEMLGRVQQEPGSRAASTAELDFRVHFIDFGLSYLVPPNLRATPTTTASPRTRSAPAPGTTRITREERELLDTANYQKGCVIQTREYRAPEIILGMHFNTKADVWSLGCMAYELVTGRFLFDPKVHPDVSDEHTMDVRHLTEIAELLGQAPAMWLQRASGKYTNTFFDGRTFRFRGERPRREVRRDLVAQVLPHFEVGDSGPGPAAAEEAKAFANFILRCVAWEPAKRATAKELLQHPWVTGTYRR